MGSEGSRRREGFWRKVARYALGIVIECAAVITISLLALLLMLIVKVIMT